MSDKKEPKHSDIIYALSDYRQLVLQYRTKYAEMTKAYMFWRTSAFWLGCLAAACVLVCFFVLSDTQRALSAEKKNSLQLETRLQSVSRQLAECSLQVRDAVGQLEQKQSLIGQLEKDISTASKRQVERLLKEKEQ